MDQLFAPWRIDWVERDDEAVDGCVFCKLPTKGDDQANRIVARGERSFVLLNNYPYNPGHVMVIPYEHTGTYGSLNETTLLDHARLKQRTLAALDDALAPDGVNMGLNLGGTAAGGSIEEHIHTHVVPRWGGDTNFMPVVSDTKVIVEAIEDTYDRLHEAFLTQDGATVTNSGAVALTFEA